MMTDELIQYEKNQSFNPILSYVHTVRYKQLIKFFEKHVSKNEAIKVVDIGCAHAKAFALLNHNYNLQYIGIEPDAEYAQTANQRYGSMLNFQIINGLVENHFSVLAGANVVLALETLEHIPANIVVKIVEKIASVKPMAFICSVPNEIGPIVWIKNVSSLLMGYMRHREYKWRETFWAGLYSLDKVGLHEGGHKGFDWRWLAQTLRHNMKIRQTYSNPLSWLPKTLSFSVIFVCQSR